MSDSTIKGQKQIKLGNKKTDKSNQGLSRQPGGYAGNGYDEQKAMTDPRTRAGVPIGKADWAIKLSQATAVVIEVYSHLESLMLGMANDYKTAMDTQQKVIDDANKRIALEMDLVLGLFGAVAGHLGSQILGNVMKRSLFDNTYLMEGTRAIEKFGIKQATGAIRKSGMKGLVGTDPLKFSNTVQKRVLDERSQVSGLVSRMEYNPHVDPRKFVSIKLKETLVVGLKVDHVQAEKYFELELWKLWVKQKGAEVVPDIGILGPQALQTVPKEIFDHLNKKFGLSRQEILSWNPMLKGREHRHVSDEVAAAFLMKQHPDWTKAEAMKKVKEEYHIDPLSVAD